MNQIKLIVGLALLISFLAAHAQVPSVISYQGRVQAGGTNFSGTGQFKFALVSPGTNVSRQATATATVTAGFVTGITVTDGGGGFVSAPAVMITDATGSGAVAVAQVSGGVVTNIVIQNAGSGYSASPTVTIAPPPLTIVHGTVWSNDGTSSAGSEPGSAVPVPVQQGLFTVFLGDTNLPNMLPVMANVFQHEDVRVRIWFSDGVNGFVQLVPDQRIGSVGYAMMTAQVSEGGVSGAALTTGSVTSAKIENGSILVEDLSLSLLNGAFWNLSGNSGATPGAHFLGTTDNQPLEFKVNGTRALRLEPNADNQPNVVGGSALNFVAPGIVGATIAGGGTEHYGGGAGIAYTNSVMADFGSIGGGFGNRIATDATRSTIAGGFGNDVGAGADAGTIGGGYDNNIASSLDAGTIAGGQRNDIGTGASDSAIGGGFDNNIANGGFRSTIAGGQANDIGASYGAIGGGYDNNIANSTYSTIAGGRENDIGVNSDYSAIGGGYGHNIGANSDYSAIGGGTANIIGANTPYGTVGGGGGNGIGTNSDFSTIGGGSGNSIGANSSYATIPGGNNNFATNRAFAAGSGAEALHSGAFVWADYDPVQTLSRSTNANSVTMRAAGGYRLFSNNTRTLGVYLAPSGGSWTSMSDRNAKENFDLVNARAILDKVAALPMSTRNYKSQTNGVRHIGPMAQDFKAAFGVGETETGITTVDADGVALAAIQGLNQKLQEELNRRDAENAGLKHRMEALEKIILNQKSN